MKLAINGGPKVRENLFPDQNTYDEQELEAIKEVMKEGRLSGFRGNYCDEFYGGPQVQAFEEEFAEKFNVAFAIAVNSATSGLIVACGASGLNAGDETIVTPYSMTCSATAPMFYNSIPVFADVEKDHFCLDPDSIEERITDRTKVIIPVSLFGQPYDHIKINAIAKKHNLIVIEDAAQAPGAYYTGQEGWRQFAGTLGDMGVFSFNFGKHITCGEGGMIVTNNEKLAMRCRLIRNHAEAVIHGMTGEPEDFYSIAHKEYDLDNNMVGFNVRMTELDAAVMRVQLKKFDELLMQRKHNVIESDTIIHAISPISPATTRKDCVHSFYALPYLWDEEYAEGIHRDTYINAVKAELMPRATRDGEGVPIGCGYITPLYLMPLFQEEKHQCFNLTDILCGTTYLRDENYQAGSCPNCEKLWKDELFLHLYHAPNSTKEDVKDVVHAFIKVWDHREELR